MLSVVTPQAQDIHTYNYHQQHYVPQQHSYVLDTCDYRYLNNNTRSMPHRVQESHMVRASSEASTATPISSSASTPPSSTTSLVPPSAPLAAPLDAAVIQALEIARESPDGGHDPTISKILEGALATLWTKVQAQPESYVMSRDEFSIFNFFQHRFANDDTARLARKRYWSNTYA